MDIASFNNKNIKNFFYNSLSTSRISTIIDATNLLLQIINNSFKVFIRTNSEVLLKCLNEELYSFKRGFDFCFF